MVLIPQLYRMAHANCALATTSSQARHIFGRHLNDKQNNCGEETSAKAIKKNILWVKRKQLANDTPVLTSQPSFHLIRIILSSFFKYIYFLKPSLLRSQGQGVTRSEEKLLVKNAIIKLPIN